MVIFIYLLINIFLLFTANIISELYDNHLIKHKIFSLCFSQNGGFISIGGVNNTQHTSHVKYLPFDEDKFYMVDLHDIMIADEDIHIKEKYNTIIDSGSTLTYLPRNLFNNIIKRINSYCSQIDKCLGNSFTSNEMGLCFNAKKNVDFLKFAESMPSLKFIFGKDIIYEWKPEFYLFDNTSLENNKKTRTRTYCTGFTSWG
jgi:hypothetical protein